MEGERSAPHPLKEDEYNTEYAQYLAELEMLEMNQIVSMAVSLTCLVLTQLGILMAYYPGNKNNHVYEEDNPVPTKSTCEEHGSATFAPTPGAALPLKDKFFMPVEICAMLLGKSG